MDSLANKDQISTGIPGIDQVLHFLRLGDNVVWQIDQIADYQMCVQSYVRQAIHDQRKIIYFRFGRHQDLLPDYEIGRYNLDPNVGFENFTNQIYQTITDSGIQAFYIFDCLSDLLDIWASDLMIGNFFKIICPYLFELDTVAYFALRRGQHSYDAIARIRETTQLLLDLYQINDQIYLHPLKVWQRFSPTMFLLNRINASSGEAITNSAEATTIFTKIKQITGNQLNILSGLRQVDYWDRLFQEAEVFNKSMALKQHLTGNIISEKDPGLATINEIDRNETNSSRDSVTYQIDDPYNRRLRRLLCGDEGQISQLTKRYFTINDLLQIKNRQIGTGKIGGKAVGMLLARKILEQTSYRLSNSWINMMEDHDSFYIGSDLYYTYIVQNGWWKLRVEQKTENGYFTKAKELKLLILNGSFSSSIKEQFQQMLEYFGQSPIIVRSSSLLEDDFGNAFAGKYESIFCANQGTPEERYAAFEQAIRIVYASTMDENALNYRLKKGLAQKDEQMALLVQRVSGAYHGQYFYPLMAGVGHSNNLYVWEQNMNPDAGMLRLVYGLGTRAVDRVEGDYPRLVALDQPLLTTHANRKDEITYSQHYVDLIDLETNKLTTVSLKQLLHTTVNLDLSLVAEIEWESSHSQRNLNYQVSKTWILTFRKFLQDPKMVSEIRMMLDILEKEYAYPVDIEFTINETSDHKLMFNLLQCRPLQTKGIGHKVIFPENIDYRNVVLKSYGHFMGGNVNLSIKYVIYVIPELYVGLTNQERYQVARLIGQLNKALSNHASQNIALIGPGRWGTTTPALGIPVHFSEINNISVLAEVAFETAGMMPEISYGSHFFQDLVETNIFYLAILPQKQTTIYQPDLFQKRKNIFNDLINNQDRWSSVIHVAVFDESPLALYSDIMSQNLLFLRRDPDR